MSGAACLCFRGPEILVDAEGRAAEPPPGLGVEDEFEIEPGFRAYAYPAGAEALPGLAWLPLRELLAREAGLEWTRRAFRGLALANWRAKARFCGACGGSLEDLPAGQPDGGGRKCRSCGHVAFPRISPAVIVLVRKEGRALLARNARAPGGRFGLVAGFVEPGESLEEAARRELLEEAGIEVGALEYRSSQPWPFPDSLMVAFTAEWAAGEARPDGEEIVELRWCLPGELPAIPPPGSVARRLIDDFVAASSRS